jgi:hypothetical protein
MTAPEHAHYLAQLGIAEKPLNSSIARRPRQTGRPKSTIGIFNETDLNSLRGLIFWRLHDDEVCEGFSVRLTRVGRTVGRIDCGSLELAWDVERICAGIRFKRGMD